MSLIDQLKQQINTHLDLCDASETPTICQMLNDAEGREKLVNLVVEKVVQAKMEIPEAIVSIENEYNINSID